jgi:hypothetical protein
MPLDAEPLCIDRLVGLQVSTLQPASAQAIRNSLDTTGNPGEN